MPTGQLLRTELYDDGNGDAELWLPIGTKVGMRDERYGWTSARSCAA